MSATDARTPLSGGPGTSSGTGAERSPRDGRTGLRPDRRGISTVARLLRGADRSVVGLLRLVLRAYQVVLSPLVGPACRFAPSCSEYARQALREHGVGRGAWLALRRIGRCHPWNEGGYDPVPLAEAHGHDRGGPRRRSHA